MKEIVNKKPAWTKNNLVDLQQQTYPFRAYLEEEDPLLENLVEYYRKSDGVTKKCECESPEWTQVAT